MPKATSFPGWWNDPDEQPLAAFGALLERPRYQAMFDFLRDEGQVREGLTELDRRTAGQGPQAFESFLGKEEARFGFSPDVKRIGREEKLLKASLFWTYLFAKRPLTDLGAGSDHGALTHRVQWVLLGQWNERRGLPLGPVRSLADLYQNLACSNARKFKEPFAEQVRTNTLPQPINTGRENPFTSVWDALFDSGARSNARFPEYFHPYIGHHFPPLGARMAL